MVKAKPVLIALVVTLLSVCMLAGCSGESNSQSQNTRQTYPDGWKEVSFEGITTCIPDEYELDESSEVVFEEWEFLKYIYPDYNPNDVSISFSWSKKIPLPASDKKEDIEKALVKHLEETSSSAERLEIMDVYESNGISIQPYTRFYSNGNGMRDGSDFFYDGKHYSFTFQRKADVNAENPIALMMVYLNKSDKE